MRGEWFGILSCDTLMPSIFQCVRTWKELLVTITCTVFLICTYPFPLKYGRRMEIVKTVKRAAVDILNTNSGALLNNSENLKVTRLGENSGLGWTIEREGGHTCSSLALWTTIWTIEPNMSTLCVFAWSRPCDVLLPVTQACKFPFSAGV